jgi:7-carboxy-7-deazaguanine synthase
MTRNEGINPGSLPIVETFHSLQGEGAHAGRSAFFVRLGGCTVGCTWCDTKNSWPRDLHPHRTLIEIAREADRAKESGAAFIVITGGEPLHHDLAPLASELRNATPLPIHLETSGVDPISGSPDWITLSPKRHAPPRQEMLDACHELKVIVHEPADLEFALLMAESTIHSRCDGDAKLFLQPGWESSEGLRLSIDFIKSHPAWRLSLQAHKLLGIL